MKKYTGNKPSLGAYFSIIRRVPLSFKNHSISKSSPSKMVLKVLLLVSLSIVFTQAVVTHSTYENLLNNQLNKALQQNKNTMLLTDLLFPGFKVQNGGYGSLRKEFALEPTIGIEEPDFKIISNNGILDIEETVVPNEEFVMPQFVADNMEDRLKRIWKIINSRG